MRKKIMIADDDPAIVKYVVTLLQDNGYETCSASDGIEANEKLGAEESRCAPGQTL